MNKNFCIVGLGLLGGSYAMSLSKQGHLVTAIDTNKQSIDFAIKNNIIANGDTVSNTSFLKNADCIVLAIYPKDILAWVQNNLANFKNGAILTDVTGVKGNMVENVQKILPTGVEFISCHPMAGREVSGIQNASETMFCGANFIITPTDKNTQKGIDFAKELAKELGFGHIATLTPNEHDKMIGYVSQLTHAIAVSLMNASDNTHLAEYTGDSFRDLTRIARINAEMWSELFLENSAILSDEIDTFCNALQGLNDKLKAGDKDGLKQLFETSTQRRAAFDKK